MVSRALRANLWPSFYNGPGLKKLKRGGENVHVHLNEGQFFTDMFIFLLAYSCMHSLVCYTLTVYILINYR